MRIETIQQFAVIRGETAEELTESLNEKLRELRGKSPKVEFDGLTAYIKYSDKVSHPECLADEYELLGAAFACSQCPEFIPRKRKDGCPDYRCKKGGCEHTTYKKTFGESAACDILYDLIREGKVRLCYSE